MSNENNENDYSDDVTTDEANDNQAMPVLPLRDLVLFPEIEVPLKVGREGSLAAVRKAIDGDRKILVVTQKEGEQDDVSQNSLYEVGTVCEIINAIKDPTHGHVTVLVKGEQRVKIGNYADGGNDSLEAQNLEPIEDQQADELQLKTLTDETINKFVEYLKKAGLGDDDVKEGVVKNEDRPSFLADVITTYLTSIEPKLETQQMQEILEETDVAKKLVMVTEHVNDRLEIIQANKNIQSNIKSSMEKSQREYYLNEQMKAIQKELNNGEEAEDEIEDYEMRICETDLSEEAQTKAVKELKKLANMSPQSAEANVIRNYLDVLLDAPWNSPSEVNNDLTHAREILDADHYGLDDVKDKVIKLLAIQKRLEEKGVADDLPSAKIICLVGPPGVGKTSICKSLSKSTGREYVRLALGGVSDEAKIRGHRTTYVGAKPGEIIEKMTKAGTTNPLFVLDEIDKLKENHQGDPASALLEVLDPEQNHSFNDHYLDVDYDLSDVMFVATANDWHNIPGPLQDRMDTIFLGSYMPDEKLEIAKRHLVKEMMRNTALSEDDFEISDQALSDLIEYYTREAGVRNLKRAIGNICAEAVMALDTDDTKVSVTADNLEKYAGKRKFTDTKLREKPGVGVITGLAYTSMGGVTLELQAVKWPASAAKARVVATGSLGDTFKESIQVAEGWIRANAGAGRIKDIDLVEFDRTIHHVDEPSDSPVDGPSAGCGLLTVIFSSASGQEIRNDVALTGKIDLLGNVRPIGGVREKVSAAVKDGYTKILLPKDNEKDLDELPQQIKDMRENGDIEIITVSKVEEVLNEALVNGFKLCDEGTNKVNLPAIRGEAPVANPYDPKFC